MSKLHSISHFCLPGHLTDSWSDSQSQTLICMCVFTAKSCQVIFSGAFSKELESFPASGRCVSHMKLNALLFATRNIFKLTAQCLWKKDSAVFFRSTCSGSSSLPVNDVICNNIYFTINFEKQKTFEGIKAVPLKIKYAIPK